MSKSEESGKNSWDFFHGQSPRKIHGQSPWPRSGGSANVVGRWKPPALDEIFSDARSMIWMMTGGTPMTWERNHHAYLWYIFLCCLECIQYTYIYIYIVPSSCNWLLSKTQLIPSRPCVCAALRCHFSQICFMSLPAKHCGLCAAGTPNSRMASNG